MSEARRRRRSMEKYLGLKKPKNPLSKEACEIRSRKIKAGKEVHRQNLEKIANTNSNDILNKNIVNESSSSISLNLPDTENVEITLNPDAYRFLDDSDKETSI